MGKTKVTSPAKVVKNSLETVKEYGSDAAKTVATTAVNEVDTLFSDLLGLGKSTEKSGEQPHKPGENVLFSSKERKVETHARAHIEYHDEIRKSGEHASKMETRQLTQQVHEILAELQRLIKSSKTMEMEFAEYAVMETPKEVGSYDMNFFEWMLHVIQQAREKVEDSGAWLSAIKGKNGKKGFINDMWKKGNTSVTMSNERSTAMSVG